MGGFGLALPNAYNAAYGMDLPNNGALSGGYSNSLTPVVANYSGSGLSSNTQGILGGLGNAILGGFANAQSPKPSNSTTTTNYSGTSTPTYSSAVLPLYNQLVSNYMKSMNNQDFFTGYQSTGQQNINQTSQGGTNSINQILAQRGQLNSPAASSALIQQELARQGQQSGFMNQIPLLQHQDAQNTLQQAGNFFSSLPYGTTQTGTSTSNTQAKPAQSNWLSGVLGGIAQALPYVLAAV